MSRTYGIGNSMSHVQPEIYKGSEDAMKIRTNRSAIVVAIAIVILSSLVRPAYALASMAVVSVQGSPDGISGQVRVSGAQGAVWSSTCTIYSSSRQKMSSYGGLADIVPRETPAKGIFSFNCYFTGPFQLGTYYASIYADFWPLFVTCSNSPVGCANFAEVETIGVPAGGGRGVPLETTVSTQSTTSTTKIQTTPTSAFPSSSTLTSSGSIVSSTEQTVSSAYNMASASWLAPVALFAILVVLFLALTMRTGRHCKTKRK